MNTKNMASIMDMEVEDIIRLSKIQSSSIIVRRQRTRLDTTTTIEHGNRTMTVVEMNHCSLIEDEMFNPFSNDIGLMFRVGHEYEDNNMITVKTDNTRDKIIVIVKDEWRDNKFTFMKINDYHYTMNVVGNRYKSVNIFNIDGDIITCKESSGKIHIQDWRGDESEVFYNKITRDTSTSPESSNNQHKALEMMLKIIH